MTVKVNLNTSAARSEKLSATYKACACLFICLCVFIAKKKKNNFILNFIFSDRRYFFYSSLVFVSRLFLHVKK
jgi:hypothetical protein